jgi:hypothetical protein
MKKRGDPGGGRKKISTPYPKCQNKFEMPEKENSLKPLTGLDRLAIVMIVLAIGISTVRTGGEFSRGRKRI